MAASATSLEYVQKMFIAYFGRPVAPTGQEYYGQLVDAGNVAALQDDFWNSAESQSLFGQATTEGKVNAIFNQLFGRDAAVAGLTYWTTEINAGRVSLPAAALTILNSAAAADLDVFNAKLAVAEAFTAELDTTAEILAFQSNTDGARELLAGVTTQAEADAVIANIVAEVAEVVAGGETNPGQTFTLTIGSDTETGTSGNDTFNGGVTLAPGTSTEVNTLNNGDVLDGGAGTDTLNATLVDDSAPTLKSIENVNARFLVTGKTLDLVSAEGVEKINVFNTAVAASTVDNIGAVADFTITNHTGVNTAAVDFSNGTAEDVKLTFTNTGKTVATDLREIAVTFGNNDLVTADITMSSSNVKLDDAGNDTLESATIAVTGTNILDLEAGDAMETLTISGSGSLDLTGQALVGLKTLTSTATGAIKVDATGGVLESATTAGGDDSITTAGGAVTTISTGEGKDTVTITSSLKTTSVVNLGAGDDTMVIGSVGLTAGATLTAGDGMDTLSSEHAQWALIEAFSTANKAKITGFELLSITDVLANSDTVDMATLSSLKDFQTAGVAAGGTATVSNIASGQTVTMKGALNTATGRLEIEVKDAATNDEAVLNVTVNSSDAATTIALTAAEVETLNITTAKPATTAITYTFSGTSLVAVDATDINFSGTEKVVFTAHATNTAALERVDGSGLAVGSEFNVSAVSGVTVTGTTKADIITVGELDQVSGNGGNDTFVITAPSTGLLYSTITDANKGDIIQFADKGTETFATTKLSLAGNAVFQDYLNKAAEGDGSTDGAISWFQFGGNTYVVFDVSVETSFDNSVDYVVELTGLVDMSTATGAGSHILTIA